MNLSISYSLFNLPRPSNTVDANSLILFSPMYLQFISTNKLTINFTLTLSLQLVKRYHSSAIPEHARATGHLWLKTRCFKLFITTVCLLYLIKSVSTAQKQEFISNNQLNTPSKCKLITAFYKFTGMTWEGWSTSSRGASNVFNWQKKKKKTSSTTKDKCKAQKKRIAVVSRTCVPFFPLILPFILLLSSTQLQLHPP